MQINYLEKSFIIELNKKIILEWNEKHPESSEFIAESGSGLDEVLSIVEKVGNDLDHKDKIIVKAAHLLGGIPWIQSFSGANKRTAILLPQYSCEEMDYPSHSHQRNNVN